MTTQEIFDKVVRHLLTQNKKSRHINERCAYRGDDNTQCAVGCLIKDEFYTAKIEGFSSTNWRVEEAIEKSLGRKVSGEEKSLLMNLQNVHDRFDVEKWVEMLRTYANHHKLTMPELWQPPKR